MADDVEQDVVVQCGDVVIMGRGKILRITASGAAGGRRKAKPGKKTSALARRAIAILIDGGVKPSQVVELLSGVHSIKERTLFNVRKSIRAGRAAIRRAREEKEAAERKAKEAEVVARSEAERREAETVASVSRSYKNFGL